MRLANGSTTIDKRGATRGCTTEVCAATVGDVADFVAGQIHHAMTAMTSTAANAALIGATMLTRRHGMAIGAPRYWQFGDGLGA